MNIPDIDRSIGIEVYSTPMPSLDIKIRENTDSFIVEEVIDTDSLSVSSHGRYALFRLMKEGIDTIHALEELRKEYKIRLRVLGRKDAHAVTKQYAVMEVSNRYSKERRSDWEGVFTTEHCRLEFIGYVDRMLNKRDLIGNKFRIGMKTNCIQEFIKSASMVRGYIERRMVANFYGYQRFGSGRAVTHLIGRAIIRREFRNAVDTLLTYTTEYEGEEHIKARNMLKDMSLNKESIDSIPSSMDIERIAARALLKYRDYIKALRSLPIDVRRLFVEAYQAYIFNRTLSKALNEGYDISKVFKDDVCFHYDGRLGEINVAESSDEDSILAVPLVGYAFRPKGRFGVLLQDILKEECIDAKDFYVKEMQEVSLEGGFRPAPLLLLYDIKYDVIDDGRITLWFGLHKGSYATILLREIIKPIDPFLQGF
jgi:tRNA pseudouridine13 synthase